MKYKVGDKIVIKKWKQMEKEFGLDYEGDIKVRSDDMYFFRKMRRELKGTNRILTIYSIETDPKLPCYYTVSENEWSYCDEMILGPYFEKGEVIEVSDDGKFWFDYEFVRYDFKSRSPFVVCESETQNFNYIYARKKQGKKLTEFNIGDTVQWTSRGGKSTLTKSGKIVAEVLPGERPLKIAAENFFNHKLMFDGLFEVKEKRYLVEVVRKGRNYLYLPLTKKLKLK